MRCIARDLPGPDISADGRCVVFEFDTRTLVTGDTNGWQDVLPHDRWTHRTTRVSVGGEDDESDAWDVFVRDHKTGVTTMESRSTAGALGNDFSYSPMISGNGQVVTWWSCADNLVPGDTNGVADVFVRDRGHRQWCSDRQANTTRRVEPRP